MARIDLLALILGGGRGSRLWPLTKFRAKPAVPIGGKYRLVDVTLSNCLNSGIYQIAVLTQFNSVSLNRHIARTFHFDAFHQGWVEVLAAEQTHTVSDWYQGTADAVRKQLFEIRGADPEDVLILAGDHLYRMDYSEMIRQHRSVGADISVAVKPVSRADAPRFGILKMDMGGRIVTFVEKPQDPSVLGDLASTDDPERPFLSSMGVYLFRARVLFELLDSKFKDFGGDVLPAAIRHYQVHGHRFDGFWEDIGTIESFYRTSLLLAQPDPPFNFHDPVRPIFTRPRFLPGNHIHDVTLDNVLLADGCILRDAEIRNSVIGNRSIVGGNAVILDSVVLGAGYYERQPAADPAIGIGAGARIQRAIIDRNARIGRDVRIGPFPKGTEHDGDNWVVRDGIVVVAKDAVLAAETVIAPD